MLIFLAGTPILFIHKINGSLWVYVWGLNNPTIKNRYPLPWIKALPSWSKCQFRLKERCFLGYVMSSHVALTFRCSSYFYRCFIQGFRWMATLLTSILKTTESLDYYIKFDKMNILFWLRENWELMRLLGMVVELIKRLWNCLSR